MAFWLKKNFVTFVVVLFCSDEGKGSSMTWMYKESKPDTEDYLLGRKIDKHVDGAAEKKENTGTGYVVITIFKFTLMI